MKKEFNFLLRLSQANMGIDTPPYKLILYLTNKCNCRCKICSIWQKEPTNELSLEEMRKFLSINNSFSWILITGGEIFLRDDIEKILSMIIETCKNLYILNFTTNGTLTYKISRIVKKIKEKFKGRLIITVSIDGYETLHNTLRGFNDCWNRAVNTFKELEKINKGNNYFGFTLSKYNVGSLAETFNALKKEIPYLTFNKILLNLAQNSDIYYSNTGENLLNNKKDIVREIDLLRSNYTMSLSPISILERKFLKLLKKYITTGRYPFKNCTALRSTITIDPVGGIYPCLFYNKKLGNLKDINYDLKNLTKNNEYAALRKDILKHCGHCWTACEAYPSILSNLW